MKVGFTGTQAGMTMRQRRALEYLIRRGVDEFHHGDCIGADAQADRIARLCGIPQMVIHPPKNPSKRAFCVQPNDLVRERKEYLDRNHDIVDECDLLIAAPQTDAEVLRSGTWATIRYARKVDKVVKVLPR